jgi:hypothetical protein
MLKIDLPYDYDGEGQKIYMQLSDSGTLHVIYVYICYIYILYKYSVIFYAFYIIHVK